MKSSSRSVFFLLVLHNSPDPKIPAFLIGLLAKGSRYLPGFWSS